MNTSTVTFLKLGGSLITDKNHPGRARTDVLARLADEIAQAFHAAPEQALVLGHGSGSFGHAAAHRHGTRAGVRTSAGWLGFVDVWKEARALNQLVVDALLHAGVPVIAFPPSAWLVTAAGQPQAGDLAPLRAALAAGLVPLVNGDTVFDTTLGGTIVSTEEVFLHLAAGLPPRRILLAGREEGVWADYPTCTRLIERLTPRSLAEHDHGLAGSASVDVTGGMREKVLQMLALARQYSGFSAQIYSGLVPGSTLAVLRGEERGTRICLE